MSPISLNENAKKWVRALRSGIFQQGQNYLRQENFEDNTKPDGFCCLGVACELAILDGVNVHRRKRDEHYTYNDSSGVLPDPVLEWLGLNSPEGSFDSYANSLTQMNDSGKSFLEIADFIESNPEHLFKQ